MSKSSMWKIQNIILSVSVSGILLWAAFTTPGYTSSRSMAAVAIEGSPDSGSIVAYVTVPDRGVADKLAAGIVNSKLAACVNIIPGISSVYVWEGKVNTDSELLLMIKTRASLAAELTAHVKSNHPYEEPEVITVPITGGSPTYLKWVQDSTREPGQSLG
eukprot:jgi/Botrbrau1/20159/Bobra.0173s0059.2